MPVAYLCDFDGTISPNDIGAAFVEHFSPGADVARAALLEAWLAGDLGHRELTSRQCELLAVTAEDALAFTRGFRLDPRFAPFAREALGRGDAVMVVSEGLGFYLRDQLQQAGLGDLPWAANEAVFEHGRVRAEFPFADAACDSCGNCKAQHVRRYRGRGFHTVLVGDGTSDRHGALAADSVLARGSLRDWCRAEGVPHGSFEHFGDVAEFARRFEANATPARGGAA